jgi:hypothetical protein
VKDKIKGKGAVGVAIAYYSLNGIVSKRQISMSVYGHYKVTLGDVG